MEHAEIYTLEAASAPLSPRSSKFGPDAPTYQTSSPSGKSKTPKTPSYHNGTNNLSFSNCFKANQSNACLETLHENSHDDNIDCMDSICFDQSFDPNLTPQKRKRKFNSPEQSSILVKRKRDKSYSERKKKVSEFFKTPINYFSNRRRTIDASSFINQSLSESVISSSGIFNVDVVQNLSFFNDKEMTPQGVVKRPKKKFVHSNFQFFEIQEDKEN